MGRSPTSWLSIPWRRCIILFFEPFWVCDSYAQEAWSLASVMLPVVGFFAPLPTVSSSWDRASWWMRRLLIQARVRVTLPPNTPFHPGHLPAVGWAYIIFDVSIDFIALFCLSFALHGCFGPTSSLYRTLVRDALYASSRPLSGTAAYESPAAATDLRALLWCVYFWPFLSCKTV